jgi:hypothetical protein
MSRFFGAKPKGGPQEDPAGTSPHTAGGFEMSEFGDEGSWNKAYGAYDPRNYGADIDQD